MYVFVYGTLKRGYGNNRLLVNAKFIDKGVTLMPFRIMDNGAFPVVFADEKQHRIAGEVYEVTPAERMRLDRLEGYPYMYHRKEVVIVLDETGIKLPCQMYTGTIGHWGRYKTSLRNVPEQDGVATWSRN